MYKYQYTCVWKVLSDVIQNIILLTRTPCAYFAIHKGIRYKIRSAVCSFGELFLHGIHLFNLLISSIIPMEHFACSNINNKTGHVLDKSSLGEFLLLIYVVNITQIQQKKP